MDVMYVGKWRKSDFLGINVEAAEGHVFVTAYNIRAQAISFSEDRFSFDWASHGKPWGVDNFVVRDGTLISGGDHVWRRVINTFLSHDDMEFFKRNGYLKIKDAVSGMIVSRARRAVFAHIGCFGIPPENIKTYNATTFVPELFRNDDEASPLLDVFKMSVLSALVNGVVGIRHRVSYHPQVAIRFPSPIDEDFRPPSDQGAHIDGIPTRHNGIAGNDLHSFSMLLGVALTDQMALDCGNLTVFPGSHRICNDVFKEQWMMQERNGIAVADRKLGPGHGAEWTEGSVCPPRVQSEIAPVKLQLEKGDAVLLHYQLAHCVGAQRSDEIRMNLYWRVHHSDHNADSLLNLWKDFEGVV
jgi:hypothetical protein